MLISAWRVLAGEIKKYDEFGLKGIIK